MIFIPKGFTNELIKSQSDSDAWNVFSENYPVLANYLEPYKEKAVKRSDKGDYWWELRACDYYNEFENQ